MKNRGVSQRAGFEPLTKLYWTPTVFFATNFFEYFHIYPFLFCAFTTLGVVKEGEEGRDEGEKGRDEEGEGRGGRERVNSLQRFINLSPGYIGC